ncbi:MAG: dihydrofolate reductase family protein [Actinomycetota bacterium]
MRIGGEPGPQHMTIYAQTSVSTDGYMAGPEPSLDEPLGRGGMQLHEWAFRLRAWREHHGLDGGEEGPEAAWVDEIAERTGAYVMGRKMFSGGSGSWEDDPNANGWWGDEPPFGKPVFVVTHHEREPLVLGATTFHFVTGGVEAALDLATAAAAGRDVQIAGGGEVIRQVLELGRLDELQLHTAPVALHAGTPFPTVRHAEELERIETPHALHVRYRVTRR